MRYEQYLPVVDWKQDVDEYQRAGEPWKNIDEAEKAVDAQRQG